MREAPVRLVIGVTGHRKLADSVRVAARIDEALDKIALEAPSRLVVLSPLAEGADRLVAERVLARGGAELEAVLPLSEAEYESDFDTAASKSEFRSLLSRAKAIHRLPAPASREEAYAAAGRFVVDHCDVLIAVWDGKAGDGPGGTADIVAYAQSRRRRLVVLGP